MNENIFRILAAIILFAAVGISSYYRRKADQETGETISRKVDGNILMTLIKIGGLILWLSPLIYLINPKWMAWSKIGLPDEVRWLGVGIGVLCVAGVYWLFSSIGSGITSTSATRMAIRTPKEEANLIEKFGEDYRAYIKITGRFLPYLGKR